MKRKRHREAIALLENDLSAVEKDFRSCWNLGWCYFNLGVFSRAHRFFVRALKLSPGHPVGSWALGLTHLKQNNFERAEKHLADSLRVRDFFPARIGLALAYLSQGKVAEAENTHLAGIERKAERQRFEAYAGFLEDVGRTREAEEMYIKAKTLPERERAHSTKRPRRK
jgi:tetratricopeptide (TPR) repeat protein